MKELSSQELRIGNYVEYGGVINKVYLLSHQYFQVESTDIPIFKKNKNRAARPIPLTEEWLLKFGFKKYPNLRDTFRQEYYDAFQLDIDEHTIILFSIPIGYNHNIRCNYDKSYRSEEKKQSYIVKYVHQLQNLYFAITGEELTLEP